MKTHFCKVEKEHVSFEGECNWCGEKEDSLQERAKQMADDIDEYAPNTNIALMIRDLVLEIEILERKLHEQTVKLKNTTKGC